MTNVDTIEDAKEWVEGKRRDMQEKSVRDIVVEMLWLADEGTRMTLYLDDRREFDWSGVKKTVSVGETSINTKTEHHIDFSVEVEIEDSDELPGAEGVIMVTTEMEWSGPGPGPWTPPLFYMKYRGAGRNLRLLGGVEALVREDGKFG